MSVSNNPYRKTLFTRLGTPRVCVRTYSVDTKKPEAYQCFEVNSIVRVIHIIEVGLVRLNRRVTVNNDEMYTCNVVRP